MNTLTIEVAERSTTDARFVGAMQDGVYVGASLVFPSVQALWAAFTPEQWAIVQALCGAGPLALVEIARRVGRDGDAVRGDVHAMLACGVLDATPSGAVVFPYDRVHVNFVVTGQHLPKSGQGSTSATL